MRLQIFFVMVLSACGPAPVSSRPPDAAATDGPNTHLPPPDAIAAPDAIGCESPAMAAGPEVELAQPFAGYYRAFALGTVPGVPSPLGGAVVARGTADPNTLLIGGSSERTDGGIYAIRVRRSAGWRCRLRTPPPQQQRKYPSHATHHRSGQGKAYAVMVTPPSVASI